MGWVCEPPPGSPPWLQHAWRDLGIAEVRGGEHPRIVEMHGYTTLKATEDEVPWCSSAINAWMIECGFDGTRSAAARSWLHWGDRALGGTADLDLDWFDEDDEADDMPLGAVAVFWRGNPNASTGHVGLYLGHTDRHIILLGGNQSDGVTITKYPRSQLLDLRWPRGAGVAPPPEAT